MVHIKSIGLNKKVNFFIVKNVSIKQRTQRRVLSVFYYIGISKYLYTIKQAYTLSYVIVRGYYTPIYIRIHIKEHTRGKEN